MQGRNGAAAATPTALALALPFLARAAHVDLQCVLQIGLIISWPTRHIRTWSRCLRWGTVGGLTSRSFANTDIFLRQHLYSISPILR